MLTVSATTKETSVTSTSSVSKKKRLHRSPRVYDFQAIQKQADKISFGRFHYSTTRIFDSAPPVSHYYFDKVSESLGFTQYRWSLKFLVDAWHDRVKRPGLRVHMCDRLRLALSWFSGRYLLSWNDQRLIEYFFHLCTEGNLKVYILPL